MEFVFRVCIHSNSLCYFEKKHQMSVGKRITCVPVVRLGETVQVGDNSDEGIIVSKGSGKSYLINFKNGKYGFFRINKIKIIKHKITNILINDKGYDFIRERIWNISN